MIMQRTIPYPPHYKLTDGAAKNLAKPDFCNTPYYHHMDFFQMHSTDTLTILPYFRTYQQTTEYTCGPCVALMLLYYFYFTRIGWRVQSSLTYADNEGKTFKTPEELRNWVLFYLSQGIPILVDWIDWGGHWQIIFCHS